MIKYGLKYIKNNKILGYTEEPSNADFSNTTIVELDHYSNNMWLVNSAEHAEYVRLYSKCWYNSSYMTPKSIYKPDELKVVSVKIHINDAEVLNIPTVIELYTDKYKNLEPEYLKLILENIKNGVDYRLEFYDLIEYYKKRNIKII